MKSYRNQATKLSNPIKVRLGSHARFTATAKLNLNGGTSYYGTLVTYDYEGPGQMSGTRLRNLIV